MPPAEYEKMDDDVTLGAQWAVDAYRATVNYAVANKINFPDLPVELQRQILIEAAQNIREIKLTKTVDRRRKEGYATKREADHESRQTGEHKRSTPTDKMKNLLMDRGWNEDDVNKMSFDEAKAEIDRIAKREGWGV